jgi:hypothetical protein
MVVVYRNRLVSFYASNSLRFFTSISMSMTKYTKFILEESHSLSPFAGGLEMTSKINHLQNPDYYLESYLAGLIEGDGHFNTPKALKDFKGRSPAAGIEVIFALKDRPSAELLKNKFGGNLYLRPNKNLVR